MPARGPVRFNGFPEAWRAGVGGLVNSGPEVAGGGAPAFDHLAGDDELGYEPVLDEVFGLNGRERLGVAPRSRLDLRLEAERLVAHAALDDLLQPDERAAADEEDVGRVDGEELLVRVLAAALRRDVGDRAFENLQKRLLDALARHVARDRGVLVLAANLIDLVDVDDALLRALHVAVGGLQELEDDVLHVLADVAGLGQRRRVHDGEGDREHARERLREQRLARPRRADEQDVGFLYLDVRAAARQLDALVVLV